MSSFELSKLIILCQKNDTKAFRRIVELHQHMIYVLAFRMMHDEEEAKDITQEVFIKAWVHIRDFDNKRTFSTWLYAIASNLCLDKLKTRKNRKQHHQLDHDVFQYLTASEESDNNLLNQELGNVLCLVTSELTPKQQLVFTLRYLEDKPVDEIVVITGLSPEKIKSNLYLAKQTIKEKLKNY